MKRADVIRLHGVWLEKKVPGAFLFVAFEERYVTFDIDATYVSARLGVSVESDIGLPQYVSLNKEQLTALKALYPTTVVFDRKESRMSENKMQGCPTQLMEAYDLATLTKIYDLVVAAAPQLAADAVALWNMVSQIITLIKS